VFARLNAGGRVRAEQVSKAPLTEEERRFVCPEYFAPEQAEYSARPPARPFSRLLASPLRRPRLKMF